MKSNIIATTADSISSGGTITGDLTVEGDMVVEGGGSLTVDHAVTGVLSLTKDSDAEHTALILVNESDAANTTGIISQRFDLEDTAGNAVDSGKILVGKEASFTDTASTQDSYLALHTSLNGALAEKIRIDSAGNLGIGETAPLANLHVRSSALGDTTLDTDYDEFCIESSGNTGMTILSGASNYGTIAFGDTDVDMGRIKYYHYKNEFQFYTNNSGDPSMVIADGGEVGIGTSAPDGTLHVHTATGGSITPSTPADDLIVENDGDGGISILTPDASWGSLYFGAPSDNDFAWVRARENFGTNVKMEIGTNQANGYIQFISGAAADAMTIDSVGNVGIGETAPENLLHVKDDGTSPVIFERTNGSNTTGLGDALIIKCSTTGDMDDGFGSAIHFSIEDVSAVNQPLAFLGAVRASNAGEDDTGDLVFHTYAAGSQSEKMRIDSVGNVGIGTASPDGILQLSKDSADCSLFITTFDDDATEHSRLLFQKADGTEADPDLISDDDVLGTIEFEGWNADSGGAFLPGAQIIARIDGSPGATSMPTDLEFWTNTGASAAVMNAFLAEGGDFYTNDGSVSSIASDERLKKDIRDFTHGLSVVNQLNPVYYKFNGKNGRNEDVEDRIGMLANIVKDIAPDITKTTMGELDGVDTELYTMSYDKLIFYVVNAIQELSAEVEKLKS